MVGTTVKLSSNERLAKNGGSVIAIKTQNSNGILLAQAPQALPGVQSSQESQEAPGAQSSQESQGAQAPEKVFRPHSTASVLKALAKNTLWVNARKAVPFPNQRVLCLHASGEMSIATRRFSESHSHGYDWHFHAVGIESAVTHWKVL